MITSPRSPHGRMRRALVLTALLAAAACEGENLYRTLPTGAGPGGGSAAAADSVPPLEARILLPLPDARAAAGDSLRVRVAAADDRALDSVVVQGLARDPVTGATTPRFVRTGVVYPAADSVRSDTVTVTAAPLGAGAADELLVVATVYDRAGLSRADTVRISLRVIRGSVTALDYPADRIADLVSDGQRVFLSNHSRNRVEVVDIRTGARSSFRVGSEPWGLAVGPARDTLYVANSGGTNISVVDLTASTLRESEALRIQTPNVELFQVAFSRDSVERVVDGDTVRFSALVPSRVTEVDYSDRPQFLARTLGGELLYSTRPTRAAADGTIRRRLPNGRIEIFLDYARRDQPETLVVVNAAAAALVEGEPDLLFVRTAEGDALTGVVEEVEAGLAELGSATRLEYFVNLEDVGLQDTTFVAVSGDHRTVAFGEGAADVGRIMLFQEVEAGLLARSGDTGDLVGNAAERVVGLALNADGTLGAARGQNAYFFDPALRLVGTGVTGSPSGGIALHPDHAGYPAGGGSDQTAQVAFVAGLDDNGTPYVDVVDTFGFDVRQRIFLSAPVTGPMIAVARPGVASGVRLYAVSGGGLLSLDLDEADLRLDAVP